MASLIIVWFVVSVFCRSATPSVIGGSIRDEKILTIEGSPYHINSDIIIEKGGKLTIEEGVQLLFSPGTGVTVRGTLIAKGGIEKENRILFTRKVVSIIGESPNDLARWNQVRLVDGTSILEGRLQIFYKEKWRSVCTNSKNWTEVDLQVICKQLGFSGGTIYHWFQRHKEDSQLMYQNPSCTGRELSITECLNWDRRQLGNGVCDFHFDIGIQCQPFLQSDVHSYWRGIYFENAHNERRLQNDRIVYRRESLSILENIDIIYAGKDMDNKAVSALQIRGVPPVMRGLNIRWSAFNGINVTEPLEAFNIENSTIANNKGFGIYVNTSVGMVGLQGVEVKENGGDGIRYVFHDPYVVVKDSFCQTGDLGIRQKYPFVLTQSQDRYRSFAQTCLKLFQVNGNMGHTLTVHFPTMISDEANEQYAGRIEVFDGSTGNSQRLANFRIINGTRPQSVTSSKNNILVHYHPPENSMVLFTIEVVANIGKAYDVNLTECNITDNNGRGLAIENQRSGTFLNWTRISGNSYVGGMNIVDGCGDVVVNNSIISGNIGDGINISYAGGFRHFDRSHFENNTGNAISFWFNETSHNRAFNFTAHLSYSTFSNNERGAFIGNICLANSFWNISMNTFSFQRDHNIQFLSCQMEQTLRRSLLQISHNNFKNNQRLSIHIVPALNIHAVIEHNRFTNHERGVLLISNQDLIHVDLLPAIINITYNEFTRNRGTFVCNIGLSENSLEQQMNFTKNRLFDNEVTEAFPNLNPRSRAAAAIVVSSANVLIYRNYLKNPHSSYELGSHIDVPSVVINATYNYWGVEGKSVAVYERIFDNKDRYNLARVEFQPYIYLETDLDTTIYISDVDERRSIMPFREKDTIGGVIMGEISIEKGTFTVTRDIYVTRGSKLHIHSGAKLLFQPFIGLMVQGELHSIGDNNKKIVYSMTSTNPEIKGTSVRLSSQTEGRLEVQIGGISGSVCAYGWDIKDAAIVCHQLGLVLNPHDWLLERSQFPSSNNPIVLSNVQCTDLDTDLTKCKAERMQDFENSCVEEVGIRCYPQSWAGLRLGMIAKESYIKNVVIENAGIFDYSTHNFKPALQVDFNHHKLENLIIRRNSDSGLGIMWNDIFYDSDKRKIVDSEMSENGLHGIVIHSQGLYITRCVLQSNSESGIHYDPMFTRDDQRDLISWISKEDINSFITIPKDIENKKEIQIHREHTYIVFKSQSVMQREYEFRITTDLGRVLGVMIISPFSSQSSEEMIILGTPDLNSERPIWDLRKNLTSFPLRSSGYHVTVKYRPGDHPDFSAILYITHLRGTRQRSDEDINIKITSSVISECGKGISSNHYNSDFNDNGDLYHRYSNETIIIEDVQIKDSKEKALFVWTPFWDPSLSNLAEINYTLLRNSFERNADGIVQYSRNIRNSKNLFHWTINDTQIINNLGGGIDVRLPFVWQYSENYTHSFVMHNTSFSNNEKFGFSLSGHFSRINITNNTFVRNICKRGLLSLSGMEKEILMEDNSFEMNTCRYIVEFNMESHADKFGTVNANFQRNILKFNKDDNIPTSRDYEPASYSMAIKGVQQINMTRNILYNPSLQYEFLAGVHTGSIENTINVAENWWGKINHTYIRERIFDFDDWNNFAIAEFLPYLSNENVDASNYPSNVYTEIPNLELPLGGRIYKSLTLRDRHKPYIIKSDLTVLPNVTLVIEAGVSMEFYPGVGILVLGNMEAYGTASKRIVMRPVRIDSLPRYKRAIPRLDPDVRLCVDEECKDRRNDGFLEIYNRTTLQWVPVCDNRFTERNSEVVCRQLGYSTFNVHLRRGRRLDIGMTSLNRFKYWPHPLECSGKEEKLSECEFRLNGYGEHSYDCFDMENFVYIYCGEDNLDERYARWGGIRFSIANFEKGGSEFRIGSRQQKSVAILNHVEIQGAGILHGEKNAAVQAVLREIEMNYVHVIESASHGVEVIGSSGNVFFNNMVIEHNLGMGVSFLTLIGETSQKSDLKYKPLKTISFPYNVFGMVSICDTNKEMVVHERLLLYYKYDNKPVDCVKIFSSAHYIKSLGFRLLQFNLFNATDYAASPDVIKIIDGDIFNESMPVIAQLGIWNKSVMMSSETEFYKSSESTLSVHLHASGASGLHGFIAEIVALPPSYTGMTRGVLHNISHSEISRNAMNAISYRSAGEIAPIITFRYNRIENNGREFFGNFTSVNSSVLLDVRNAEDFFAHNNLFISNQGGLHIYADSEGNVPSLNGLVTNNLFIRNKNREVLLVKGGNIFQEIKISRNYFTRNVSPYTSNIKLIRVTSEFTLNMLYNNTGLHQLSVLDIKGTYSNQRCIKNSFFDNKAVQPDERSTIVAANPGQLFRDNYLVNPNNDYELASINQSEYINSLKNRNEFHKSFVEAAYNWWGFESVTAVQGRIKDYDDFDDLLKVNFHPYYKDNSSVLSGKCAGGWHKVGSTCFTYVGGGMTYSEAKKLCESDNGSIPYVKNNHEELSNFVKSQQIYYIRNVNRFWVQSIDVPLRRCAILQGEVVQEHRCDDYLPFLCERDPQISINAHLWYQEPLSIAALTVAAVAVLFTILCVSFWLCKSRQRYREKLSRRNSIRASMRSNRSLTSAGYGNICYNRRLEQPTKLDITSEKKINGSIDSIEKSPSRFSCSLDDTHSYDTSETPNQQVFDTRFNDVQLENETANTLVRPTFDLTYKNSGFVDRSEESRDWSMGSDSTLNMKRTLEQDNSESKDEIYQSTPSMYNTTSGSSNYDSRRPLETAM